jgi:hypothetical protein
MFTQCLLGTSEGERYVLKGVEESSPQQNCEASRQAVPVPVFAGLQRHAASAWLLAQ